MRNAVNFVAFQIGWFAAVLGAGTGRPWLGVVVVPLVLLLAMRMSADSRGELRLALSAAALGFVVDTLLIVSGVFLPIAYATPYPLSPLWMVMLWVNQATTLNFCMSWLRGRYAIGALFGAIGGPLAYLAGAKLGAAAIPSSGELIVLAIVWMVAFPALLALNRYTGRR
ncbi:MAG: DUF2878 domain-containing protein [Bryobacteraceae bacterium]